MMKTLFLMLTLIVPTNVEREKCRKKNVEKKMSNEKNVEIEKCRKKNVER